MQWLMKRWLILGLSVLPLTALADAQPADAGAGVAAAEPAPAATFSILEYQIVGNTVLSNLAIEQAVYPHLGEKKSVTDVEQARQALEKAYHDAGYLTVLVDIPEQEVKSGLVRLKVTEATVDRLKVSGSRYYSLGWIRQHTPALAEGSVPYFPDVQKQLTDLARTPDRQVVPVLRAGRAPGTVEVDLQVKDKLPLHGSLEANNRYGANTTPGRLVGTLRYDNLWQRQHSLSLSYQVAPEKPQESNVLSATYVIPGADGQAYALYAVRSRSNVAAVSGFTSLGMGNFYGLRWITPLRSRGERYNHTLSLGVDYKNSLESVLGGADTANAINTSITYVPYMIQYAGTLREGKALTQFDIAANFHLRGSRNNDQDFANKRYLASANYFYLRGDVQHTQPLGQWSVYTKMSGQVASGPLISNEQFSAGGADSVRGYLEAEALGDDGVQGTLELHTPSLFNPATSGLGQVYALAFMDGAWLSVMSPLPSQQSVFLLSSAGLGLRVQGFKGFQFGLDWARPFKSLTYTQADSSRIHARLLYEF
ncbi:hemolysin activation/secretion protein associated with VreARI signalling system [Sulfuriferula multivorans]|uniref:Hemolysin activation/secretion protein associated with VreARI signalling system n=2 Tax=Sulfuriferula multivorans TaxID=1559896 RepID=A0A401JBT4_9PROT|nr:hemolysin activation/secretion protein associated with VreARI signalling system [Sulfuriferula multivorans]